MVILADMNRGLVVAVVGIGVAVLIGVGVWYMSQSKTAGGLDQPAQVGSVGEAMPVVTGGVGAEELVVEEDEGAVAGGEVKEFTVTGSNFKFNPTQIKVKKGETVRVLFKSEGTFPHNFVIEEYEVETNQLNAGDEEEVEFVVDKAGTFDFYCSVGQHKADGMVGKLVVE